MDVLFVGSEDHAGTIVEVYANTAIGKRIAHTVLVAVVNPRLDVNLGGLELCIVVYDI